MSERWGARRGALASSMTRNASLQSYLTIRWLADRAYRADAFALYAYFRWLDDTVDEHLVEKDLRLAFVGRQRTLLSRALAGGTVLGTTVEEELLVGLVRRDLARATNVGLLLSLRSMFDVMEFDARRRGCQVSQAELDAYTHDLAVAVTEALHQCIGHGRRSPHDETRYVAVTGAHIAHMLRDLAEDLGSGYRNVPAGLLDEGPVDLEDLHAPAVRAWVRDRVELARSCFATGRRSLVQVESVRCRFAGHAYIARFEWVLDAIERDGYRVRASYPERATLRGGVRIAADGARSALAAARARPGSASRGAGRPTGAR